jgi:hypothetical protein
VIADFVKSPPSKFRTVLLRFEEISSTPGLLLLTMTFSPENIKEIPNKSENVFFIFYPSLLKIKRLYSLDIKNGRNIPLKWILESVDFIVHLSR